MPIVSPSSYSCQFCLNNRHLQTIYPSFFRKCEAIDYDRETFIAPDGEPILLDWSGSGSRNLMIINHGLCGYTRRHYVLSMVQTFNRQGWDCLAWNYRWTGQTATGQPAFTSCDSTDQLAWVTEYAIASRGYKKVAFCGFSMGGDLCLLYLTREVARVPREVVGGVFFCATIDMCSSIDSLRTLMGRVYEWHFVRKLKKAMLAMHSRMPDRINVDGLDQVTTLRQFDDRFTAPLMGFADAHDYWRKASACQWLDRLQVPVLLVNPLDDPFLSGHDYPVEEARRSQFLYLEPPKHGGHCGFITTGRDHEWWPLQRAKEFILPLA